MQDPTAVTMFLCANCARPGKEPTSAGRTRPVVPEFNLPGRVDRIVVPCTGRLQPEHILRALESGSSIVSVVGCEDDNCHYAEGSRRCALRIEYIRSILGEIGLGDGRLLFFHLPGSASQDLEAATGKSARPFTSELLNAQIADLRARMIAALQSQPPNPLARFSPQVPSANSAGQDFGEGDTDE